MCQSIVWGEAIPEVQQGCCNAQGCCKAPRAGQLDDGDVLQAGTAGGIHLMAQLCQDQAEAQEADILLQGRQPQGRVCGYLPTPG